MRVEFGAAILRFRIAVLSAALVSVIVAEGNHTVVRYNPPTMRIGIYTEIYKPVLNGVVVSIETFREQLEALGHEVYIFAPAYMAYADPNVLAFHSLPLPTQTRYRLATPFRMRAAVPELDIIHAQCPFMTGLLALNHARRIDVPLIFTYHTRLVDYSHYVPVAPSISKSLLVWVSRTYSNMADRVVVPAAPIKALLESYGVQVPIDVVPTDVRLRPAEPSAGAAIRARLGLDARQRLLLNVGRLAREKNLDMLLEAFAAARSSDTHLVLVGEGPLRTALEARAAKLQIQEAVTFVGAVERDAIAEWYRAADLFVFTSLTETQGLVVDEALQLGVPVLAVAAGGVVDVLDRWPGGRMVCAAGDVNTLRERYSQALRALLGDAVALHGLRQEAASNVRAGFDGQSTRHLLRTYETAIAERKAALVARA